MDPLVPAHAAVALMFAFGILCFAFLIGDLMRALLTRPRNRYRRDVLPRPRPDCVVRTDEYFTTTGRGR